MSIRLKMRINAMAFVVLAVVLAANEIQMRFADEILALIPVMTVP